MKKSCCKFFTVILCLAGVGGIAYLLKDKIKEAIFNSKYEDEILKLLDVARLALDLLSWPINYVKAILP